MTWIKKLLDYYLSKPMIIDFLIIIIYLIVDLFAPRFFTLKLSLDHLNSIFSSLLSTEVTIAGFILAALTIILTIKANIQSKANLEEADTALEYLFSTDYYPSVLRLFRDSIIELSIAFVVSYAAWIFCEANFCHLIRLTTVNLIVLFASIFRSLFILFSVVHLDLVKRK